MIRVALYARYSSDRQNERSVDDQFAVCRRHAEGRGWEVVAMFSDAAISGAAMATRPGIQSLLAAAAGRAFDVVLTEETDRLARDREHQAHIFKRLKFHGIHIATLTTDRVTEIESTFKGLMDELYLANLSAKTSRGMRENAALGLATGSRTYGYRADPGGNVLRIVEAEAAVIRRIFNGYAGGATARDLANALNAEGVPGPRGGHWNASTISGSRARANGILGTDLYVGVKVWNRMDVVKDPDTEKRLPRLKPQSEWKRTPVPDLRIVDQDVWDAVQRRRARQLADPDQPIEAAARTRHAGPFAGLLKCGFCGASYTGYTGGRLICAGHREKGDAVCGNNRTVSRAHVEERVLEGLRTRLLAPDAVAAYVRAYHAAWVEETRQAAQDLAPVQKREAELSRRIDRLVEGVETGQGSPALFQRLREAEEERDGLRAKLADLQARAAERPPVTLHPRAASHYAKLVEKLQRVLAGEERHDDASWQAEKDAIRALIIRIEITPKSPERGGEVAIDAVGDLARFMVPPGASTTRSMDRVVAGASFSAVPTSRAVRWSF